MPREFISLCSTQNYIISSVNFMEIRTFLPYSILKPSTIT